MIINWHTQYLPDAPYDAFDADGVCLEEPICMINTETGECHCIMRHANGTFVIEDDTMQLETKYFKAPIRVINCYGQDVIFQPKVLGEPE